MKRNRLILEAGIFAVFASLCVCEVPLADDTQSAPAKPPQRVEARSGDLLAVGIVNDDRMTIHLSRLIDNAPVRDAALSVLLRGVVHPTVAEADGSYALQSKDLGLPGSAALVFQIAQGDVHEDLPGALQVAATPVKAADNGARQLWWWALNFAVCIGFLLLLSRRRKAAAAAPD